MTAAAFKGTESQQALAEEIFRLMITQGALFAVDAPIKQSLANLADFLAGHHKRDREQIAGEIDAALLENDMLFQRHEVDGQVLYVTSRQGNYVQRIVTDTHSFRQRLSDQENLLPIDDISVVVSTSRPAITTVEPVFISDYWQIQAGMVPMIPVAALDDLEVVEIDDVELEDEIPLPEVAALEVAEPEIVVAEVPVAVIEEPVVALPQVLEQAVVAEKPARAERPVRVERPAPVEKRALVEQAAPVEKPAEQLAPVEKPAEKPAERPAPVEKVAPTREYVERNTVITLADGLQLDLRRPARDLIAEHGARLEKILSERIEQDALRRIVSFGRSYYPEASVANLGKNDLRKIRDYIIERNEPLLDTELIADVFYHNPRQGDYEGFRFSLNYRLQREKDFEFVGVEGARLWSVKGLPAIGTKRVKAAEMGQITSYLIEGHDDSLSLQSAEAISGGGSMTRLLTFFEWEYGVLPFDASVAALVPVPMLPDQRGAVLRFESPQHFTSYLVEVRYPTGNRGGWLQGLDEFFREHLVPGALITITRGSEPNVFSISYDETAAATDRLLTLDEKKNKFAFANLTYYCAVDEDQLPSQSRFGKLKNLKSLPMGERRKSEMVLEHVFETVGDQGGSRSEPRYTIGIDELLLAYNVLRPGSKSLLRMLLINGENFSADEANPDRYLFTPAPRDGGSDEEASEEGEELQPARRRFGRYGDDDE